MSDRLKDKVAIIVGAGQASGNGWGNGRAIAARFAEEGARLFLVDKTVAAGEATLRAIADRQPRASILAADITDEEACRTIAASCLDEFSQIDILVNNVGIASGVNGTGALDIKTWNETIEVNLTGMFLTCKHVIPAMRRFSGSAVVNISSAAAVVASPDLSYKVSKAGVNALTHHLATANFRYGLRVNAVMPGMLETPMAMGTYTASRGLSFAELKKERDALVPLAIGMGSAWDTANAALFLASDEARFITGAVLPVDGGQTARIG